MAKKPLVYVWSGGNRYCGRCRKKLQVGDKYILYTARGTMLMQRRHYPRCPK